MIAWADDNAVNGIPGIRGSGGDEMGDMAGRDRDGDADLYFTQDADPNAAGLGDAAAGEAFDGNGHTPYGQPPILDPDQAGPPASRPPRDCSPFAKYVFSLRLQHNCRQG